MGALQSKYLLLTRAGIIAQSSAPNAPACNLSPSRHRTKKLVTTPMTIHAIAIEYTLWVSSMVVGGGSRFCSDEAMVVNVDDDEGRRSAYLLYGGLGMVKDD